MSKTKTREITLAVSQGAFDLIFKKFKGEKKDYDFEGISILRKLFSNERARILSVLKHKKPDSIYSLAKILNRDFKSVNNDIKLLERFGFIDLIVNHKGKRKRIRPVIIVDSVDIRVQFA